MPNENPFLSENQTSVGGVWGGKTVLITQARCYSRPWTTGDGSPVYEKDFTTGEYKRDANGAQIIKADIGLHVSGIVEGKDKEHTEFYSCGAKLRPLADGAGFEMVGGGPLVISKQSHLGKFTAALQAANFDMGRLYAGGKQNFPAMAGARIEFSGEPKKTKDGKDATDNNGYVKYLFLPKKFLGQIGGATVHPFPAQPGTVNGNGALTEKAIAAVKAAIASGPLSKSSLIGALSTQLNGNPQMNEIIGLVVSGDKFLAEQKTFWTYDNFTIAPITQ